MAEQKDPIMQFDEILDRLNRQRGVGIQSLAFLEATSRSKFAWNKYKASDAGNVVNLAINCIESSLQLFCNRVWDQGSDSQSIPKAIQIGENHVPELVARHVVFFEEHEIKRDGKEFEQKFENLKEKYCEIAYLPVRSVLRVIRTESLAHLVADSRDRERNFASRDAYENHGVTRDDLFDFARFSIGLIDDLLYFRDRLVPAFDEQYQMFEGYTDTFWQQVPIFRELDP